MSSTKKKSTRKKVTSSRNDFASVARKAMRAVVQVYIEGINALDPQSILDPRYNVPATWTGSGFFIKVVKNKIHILTNSHVVRNARTIKIFSYITSEEAFKVRVVGQVESMDPDVALLEFETGEEERFLKLAGEIPVLKFADPKIIRRGMEVKAIGYPLGMDEPHISGGEISNFMAGGINFSERLVTDASINPGNSGGPAIISTGEVIGMNTAIIVGANNIGFITPINFVSILLKNLLEQGRGALSELGGRLQKNSESNARFLKMKSPQGVIVTRVQKSGLLAEAKAQIRDVLLSINGIYFDRHGLVTNDEHFRHRNIYDIVRLIPIGSKVKMKFIRNGKPRNVTIEAKPRTELTVAESSAQPLSNKRFFIHFQGMILQKIHLHVLSVLAEIAPEAYERFFDRSQGKISSGVMITFIQFEGQAFDLALEVGDVVHSVDGIRIKSLEGLQRVLNQAIGKGKKLVLFEMESGAIAAFDLKGQKESVKIEDPFDHLEF